MSRRGKLASLIAGLLLAILGGCASRLAPHDPSIAAGLVSLQSSNDRFFDELRAVAGTPDAAWECHTEWYTQTRADIAALRVRAASHGAASDPTIEALALLEQSIEDVEELHVAGLSAGEIPVLHSLLSSQLRMLMELESAKKRGPLAGVMP